VVTGTSRIPVLDHMPTKRLPAYATLGFETERVVAEVAGIPGRSKRWVSIEVLRAIDPEERPFTARPAT
jgi:hypothetical protein